MDLGHTIWNQIAGSKNAGLRNVVAPGNVKQMLAAAEQKHVETKPSGSITLYRQLKYDVFHNLQMIQRSCNLKSQVREYFQNGR